MYLTVVMVVLVAFVSLAVDLGRVQLVKGELQLAADAAARHGAGGLETGVSTARANAVSAAADNRADGYSVALDPDADVEFGTWSGSSFLKLPAGSESAADAIQVTARRTGARGNAVPLLFAPLVGRATFDVKASSVARYKPDTSYYGIVGLNGVSIKNNGFVGAYNSAITTTPTEAGAVGGGKIYSNGAISGGNGTNVKGGAEIGPSAPAVTGMTMTGTTTRVPTSLPAPAMPAWTPAANPNGIPQDYTANGNVTLPGGDYWFTSLNVQGTLSFSGPATLIINGPLDVEGALQAYNLIPAKLKIYVLGNNPIGNGNNLDLVADISAPSSDFVVKNNLMFRGRMVVKSIDIKNNAEIFYDAALGGGGNASKVVTVR